MKMTFTVDPNAVRLQKTSEWAAIDAERVRLTNLEKELRSEVIALSVPEPGAKKTHTVELSSTHKLKIEFPVNTKLVHPEKVTNEDSKKTAVDAADDLSDELVKLSPNEGAFIVDRLFRWEVKISQTEYKNLSPAMKEIVDRYITTEPGTPTAKLEAVKAK